ncbi:hypothetical protein [Pseudonocardia lacus]|uniref:hypothetical protein n=1 Tax=Pseudonocardia lacus TaxID=2835865 RepID=UPI001BDC1132|nr:hypothetical protein [Pseudonocardia lacus]
MSEVNHRFANFVSRHPLWTATGIVALGAAGGFSVAVVADGKLSEVMLTASTTLIFVAFIGGVVKLLLDDIQRRRERRNEQSRFVAALLADLKSVYDRVERCRILVAAHRSALTYGNEMRELVDSAVQLRNVVRALDSGTSDISDPWLSRIRMCVKSMEEYLRQLLDEFTTHYKRIADRERICEAALAARIREEAASLDPAMAIPENSAWLEIVALPKLKEFREVDSRQGPGIICADRCERAPFDYWWSFVRPLDLASWILRAELRGLRGGRWPNTPEDLLQVLFRLECERA